ncbi:uncharacterized protein TNCV_1796481 [Trichonephila clavipes]|nr:uncharacterized protein TNCV_1796481 [Trichonephila clavipes]
MLDVTKYPPSAHGFTCRNCGGGDRGRVAIYRPFGEVSLSLNRTVTCMVLKANDRRTCCPCHDEFRGPRSDYVRQHSQTQTTQKTVSLTAGSEKRSHHYKSLLSKLLQTNVAQQVGWLRPSTCNRVGSGSNPEIVSIADASCTLIGPPFLKSRPPLQAQVSKTKNIRVPDRGLKAAGAA